MTGEAKKMADQRVGVYPGAFDPVTNGHLDIISRALHVVDHLIVAVALYAGKAPLFSLDERHDMMCREIAALEASRRARVEVRAFDNLLMDFVHEVGAPVIIRGLRAVSDFEYEFQMAGMNARLAPEIETVFLMASDRHQFIASRLVKEVGRLGGDITPFVSESVARHVYERFARNEGNGGVLKRVESLRENR
jgi:pantetheine-phosphate adenylyltransferase